MRCDLPEVGMSTARVVPIDPVEHGTAAFRLTSDCHRALQHLPLEGRVGGLTKRVGRVQLVDATPYFCINSNCSANTSAGVFHPNTFLGRLFSG